MVYLAASTLRFTVTLSYMSTMYFDYIHSHHPFLYAPPTNNSKDSNIAGWRSAKVTPEALAAERPLRGTEK